MHILLLLLHVWSIHGWDRLRLQGGEGPCDGRVEVFHNGVWGVVCNHKWHQPNEQVICRSVGCGVPRGSSLAYTIPGVPKQAWMNEVHCAGTELHLWDCPFPGWGVNPCPTVQHVNVECSEKVSLTLEYGCAGAVHFTTSAGSSISVCDKNWGKEEADVVCRELNCGESEYVPLAGTFRGAGQTPISSLNCSGHESFLWQCVTEFGPEVECPRPVGVICSNYSMLRLTGGPNGCSGRLEAKVSGVWRSVCETDFDLRSAGELCSRLRCGDSGTLEPETCSGSEQVNLTCSDAVEVVLLDRSGNESRCFGAVHVRRNGTYEAVCEDMWTETESAAVCRELGCGHALSVKPEGGGHVGKGRMSLVQCLDSNSSLSHCLARHRPIRSCQTAYVVCQGSVGMRLADGLGRCSGRVEFLQEADWKRVRAKGWTTADLNALCGRMDCGGAYSRSKDVFSHGSLPMWEYSTSCVFQSSDRCARLSPKAASQPANLKVICVDEKMLYLSGDSPCSGKVGLETMGKNYWLTGRADVWGNDTANVVCRQAQCGNALSFKTLPNASEAHEVWKSTYECSSAEKSLFDCPAKANESSRDVAFVSCSGTKSVSLQERCWGKVLVCIGDSPCGGVCQEVWTQKHSDMVCQDLGCGDALPGGSTVSKTPGTLYKSVHCATPAQNLTQCHFVPNSDETYCDQNPAHVVCAGSIQARLLDPRDRCAGNAELFIFGDWYPVCKQSLENDNIREAICKEAGCGSQLRHACPRFQPLREVSGIDCSGKTLKECQRTALPDGCVPGSVQCSGWVRMLLGDGSACQGRVFVLGEDGEQYPLAAEGWGDPESQVLCRYLRCGRFVRRAGQTSQLREWWAERYSCLGNETSIWDCAATATPTRAHSQQLHIECSDTPTLKLSHHCYGQVEMNTGGERGGVCGELWSDWESGIVCQELGCSHAIDHNTDQRQGVLQEANYVSCNGSESKLWQCATKHNVCFAGLVSVACADSVELKLTEECGGEVKIFYWGHWESVCPLRSPTYQEANLICSNLGCGDAVPGEDLIEETTLKNMKISISCTGSEKFIKHCVKPLTCAAQKPAFVYCQKYSVKPQKRLTAGVIVVIVLIVLACILAAALIFWLVKRRERVSKRGVSAFESGDYENAQSDRDEISNLRNEELHELTTRALPKVPESGVNVDGGSTCSSGYDDIALVASTSAHLLEEEPAATECAASGDDVTEGEAESVEEYDDVIAPPQEVEVEVEVAVVSEPLLLQNCEKTSE